ncbi:MAG: Gfo/Idh/MocA family oxidoreductase [Oscillospiraceae bacterium]|nr:Gfo/Idh/MocA family oxidoreductase [Oscillospiraceae bacterium]
MKISKVGVVGCGNISGIYFENLTKVFGNTEVTACADLSEDRAKGAAEKYGIPKVLTFEEMLSDDQIDVILNITTPKTHYSICKEALLAGKNVYVEKPLCLTFTEGRELVELAAKKNLKIGGAPDTFMGAAIQTCCKLIDDGFIGKPVGATAFMMCRGHEGWHPDPEFYYETGGGPMFDMGPYYLTALVNLLGNVTEVCGMNSISFPTRTITSAPKFGKVIDVEVDTHVAGLLRFENGAIGTIITSFDVCASTLPRIEIYGTKGSLIVPDPNGFGGEVKLSTTADNSFKSVPLTHIYANNSRGIGLAQMMSAAQTGGDVLASGELTCHVLEIMEAMKTSDTAKSYYKMTGKFKPARMSSDLINGSV